MVLQHARHFAVMCVGVFFIVLGSVDAEQQHLAFIPLLLPALLQCLYHALCIKNNAVTRSGFLEFDNIAMHNVSDQQTNSRGFVQLFAATFILTGLFGLVTEAYRLAYCVPAGLLIYVVNHHFHSQGA
jgi:uncharacterized membrane protein